MSRLIILTILLTFLGQISAQQQQQYRRPIQNRYQQQQQPAAFRQTAPQPQLLQYDEELDQIPSRRPKVYEVRSQISPNMGDGHYRYFSETSDGLTQEQEGFVKRPSQSSVKEGSYTTFDEHGNVVTINYVADRHGFRPAEGSLPVGPVESEEHVRAREDILRLQKQIRDEHLGHLRAGYAAAG